jgi:hypothetical protein
MQVRVSSALASTLLMVVMAACTVTTTPTTTKDTKKKGSPSPAAASSTAAKPSATPTPKPSTKPSGSPAPSEEPGLPGTPPPFKFPYSTAGRSWNYVLKVKAGAFPLSGSITMTVAAVGEADATVKSALNLDSSLFGGGSKPTDFSAKIKKDVDNPFSLAVLLSGADVAGTAAASAKPKIDTSSTIDKYNKDKITVEAGDFQCVRYYITQKAGADNTRVILWIDEATGDMVKEQVDSDKPPDLGLPIPAGVQLGKTSTTLTLKSVANGTPPPSSSPKPNGSATPKASTSPDGTSTGAASPSPSPSPSATTDATSSGT